MSEEIIQLYSNAKIQAFTELENELLTLKDYERLAILEKLKEEKR